MPIRCAVASAGKMGVFDLRQSFDPVDLVRILTGAHEFTTIFFDSFPKVVGLCGVDLGNHTLQCAVNHTIGRCGNNSWGSLPRGSVVIVGSPDPNTGEFTNLPQSFIDEMPCGE